MSNNVVTFPGRSSQPVPNLQRIVAREYHIRATDFFACIGMCIDRGEIATAKQLFDHVVGQWGTPLMVSEEIAEIYNSLSDDIDGALGGGNG